MSLELQIPLNPSKQVEIVTEGDRPHYTGNEKDDLIEKGPDSEDPKNRNPEEQSNIKKIEEPNSNQQGEPEKRKITLEADSYVYGIVFNQTLVNLILQPLALILYLSPVARATAYYVRNMLSSSRSQRGVRRCCTASAMIIIGPVLFALLFIYEIGRLCITITCCLIPLFIFALPWLFVPVLQVSCLAFMELPTFPEAIISDNNVMLSMAKIFISVINILQISNEAFQGVKNVFYAYDRFFKDDGWCYIMKNFGYFCPGLMQLALTLIIEYYSMNIIFTSEGPLSLITNFAGLYVILEFDVYIIKFIKSTKIILGILKLADFFGKLQARNVMLTGLIPVKDMKIVMIEIRDKDELEIEEEPKNKCLFDNENRINFFVLLLLLLNSFFPYIKIHLLKW